MEVKPTGSVIVSMDCNPVVVPLDGSTTCTVHLKLKSADSVMLNLEEVDFGGKKVWPNGPSSVTVNKQTVTLTPTNMQEDLTITVTINDKLANYYFGERPWDPIDRYVFRESFKDRFAGYTYLVTVKFDNEVSISDTFEIVTPSGLKELAKTAESAKAIIYELLRGRVSTSEGVSALVTSGKILTKAGIKGTGKFMWGIGNFLLAGQMSMTGFSPRHPQMEIATTSWGDEVGTLRQDPARAFGAPFNLFSFHGS